MQGAGTRSSPIILDDDGDAVMSTPPPAIPPFLHNANIPLPNFGGSVPFQHAISRDGELNMNVDENPFATNLRTTLGRTIAAWLPFTEAEQRYKAYSVFLYCRYDRR